jgi:VanZ family protein
LKTFKASILVAVAWLALITILLCIPGSRLPKINWEDKILLDKWVHFFLFLILVLLWCTYFTGGSKVKVKEIFLKITILSMIYGIGMEIVQHYFIPLRSFSYGDIIADGLGSVAGYFISVKRFGQTRI